MPRIVAVTGAAGALGQEVFNHFAAEGDTVIALDYSNATLAETFPDRKEPHRYLAVDLTSRAACAAVFAEVMQETGPIHVLCNIAGGFLMGESVHETSDASWDFLFNLNTRSIVNTAAVVVPAMLDRGGGKIINVAARAASAGAAQMGAYTASKAAVMRLTESMALELRDQQINVNCIMPGVIDTPRNRDDMPDADHARWVPPAQLASVIGFLASDDAIAVHGAAIPVDGLS
ncbi:MAG: SDR family NAD(P)-dependent oxidoreductase [Pseudomonadales bacterium]